MNQMQEDSRSNQAITRESYQATAEQFANNVADLAPLGSIEKFAQMLPENAKIIDLGCGSGRDAHIFTGKGLDVLGIDYCPNLLDIATKNASLAKFKLMDFESMTLPVSAFDGVWAVCSLGHVAKANFPKVLEKINQILKPGGHFYLALKKGKGETMEIDSRYAGNFKKFWSYYEDQELKDLLHAAQFKILELETVAKNHAYQPGDAFRVFCQKI